MNSTQLWVESQDGDKIKLDLYKNEPIKLTFTAETLQDFTQVNSTFSQAFRVPATNGNSAVFKWWFNANINDFDSTQKLPAEIVTDEGLFLNGHVRLIKTYTNGSADIDDYECLFFGGVRDFATQVGDIKMNELANNDLYHLINYSNIVTSWEAEPGSTSGLLDGNVVYPLVDYGYTYKSDGDINNDITTELTEGPAYGLIAVDDVAQGSGANGNLFINNTPEGALKQKQFRPWIRAKWLIDAMFAITDYDYESSFLTSDLFDQVYVNATGNEVHADFLEIINASDFQAIAADGADAELSVLLGDDGVMQWNVLDDRGNNFTDRTTFTAPVDGDYDIEVTGITGGLGVKRVGGTSLAPALTVEVQLWYKVNSTKTNFGTAYTIGNNENDKLPSTNSGGKTTLSLTAGDTITVGFTPTATGVPAGHTYTVEFRPRYDGRWIIDNTPLAVNPVQYLNDDTTLIDWYKGILNKFNLVMVPKLDDPLIFEIEPWDDYIGSGASLDWTTKLDVSRDVQLKPLFSDLDRSIKFTDEVGNDYQSTLWNDEFGRAYGSLTINTGIDILKDTREVTTPFASTPVAEALNTSTSTDYLIPTFYKREPEEDYIKYLPIKSKPRLMFYHALFITSDTFYLLDDSDVQQPQTSYPRLSYVSSIPTSASTLNINWTIDNPVWSNTTTTYTGLNGKSVYDAYWKSYITNLYSNEGRIMTAYFNLTAQDLKVEFKDTIFIRDSWWRILKIYNAPVDGNSLVKVDLVKVPVDPSGCDCKGYIVSDNRRSPSAVEITYTDCSGSEQVIEVNDNATSVCSCEPFVSGINGIEVVQLSECASIQPVIGVPVRINAESTSSVDTVITQQTSDDNIIWTNGDSLQLGANDDLDDTITFTKNQSNRLVFVYDATVNYWQVEWSEDGDVVSIVSGVSESSTVSPTDTFSPPYALSTDVEYSLNITVQDTPFE